MKEKIVLFGGTFDPIHYGHIKPVSQACAEIGANKLIFIPCHIPPHKQSPAVTSNDRLAMVQIVAAELNHSQPYAVSCSDYELTQGGQSYTRRTIEHFATEYPSSQLYFVIGMDSYVNFTKWHKWDEILNYCRLLVLNRPGYKENQIQQPKLLLDKSEIVDVEQVDISSTRLRQDVSVEHFEQWLTPAVKNYIVEHKLYSNQ